MSVRRRVAVPLLLLGASCGQQSAAGGPASPISGLRMVTDLPLTGPPLQDLRGQPVLREMVAA